jgi:hypothetical protein
VNFTPVAWFFATTDALGSAAPCGSVTVPLIRAFICAEAAANAKKRNRLSRGRIDVIRFIFARLLRLRSDVQETGRVQQTKRRDPGKRSRRQRGCVQEGLRAAHKAAKE